MSVIGRRRSSYRRDYRRRGGWGARRVAGSDAIDLLARRDPDRAKGLDGALYTVASKPFGAILLIGVALGLIAFGLLSFFEAKWRRTYGGVPV